MNPDSLPSTLHKSRVDALRAVIEGECDGLAISKETAEAILHYVDSNAPSAAPQGAQPAEPLFYAFKHNRGNGKVGWTWHTPEDYPTAYRDTCLEIIPLYASPADAAPVPQEVRMLTQDEREEVFNKRTADPEGTENIAVMLQRKFCEVNGLTIPAKEQR